MINADKLAKRIAGHSNYHGDSILAAIYCAAEGKENDAPIQSIETPPNEPLTLEQLRAQNGALLTAMEAINNAAVEYLERGPYDDGEQTAVLFAQAVNELSRVFVSAPPESRPPEGVEDT